MWASYRKYPVFVRLKERPALDFFALRFVEIVQYYRMTELVQIFQSAGEFVLQFNPRFRISFESPLDWHILAFFIWRMNYTYRMHY